MSPVPAQGVVPLQLPEKFVHNIGDNSIPFTITNEFGQAMPAHFVEVHMMSNPYVIRHLTLNGAAYWGELHVEPANCEEPLQLITDRWYSCLSAITQCWIWSILRSGTLKTVPWKLRSCNIEGMHLSWKLTQRSRSASRVGAGTVLALSPRGVGL